MPTNLPLRNIVVIDRPGETTNKYINWFHTTYETKFDLNIIRMDDIKKVKELIKEGSFPHHLYMVDEIDDGTITTLLEQFPKEKTFVTTQDLFAPLRAEAMQIGRWNAGKEFFTVHDHCAIINCILCAKQILIGFESDNVFNYSEVIRNAMKTLRTNFHYDIFGKSKEVGKANIRYDLYILDRQVYGNLTGLTIKSLPTDKIIVINADASLYTDLENREIVYTNSVITRSAMEGLLPKIKQILNLNQN